MLGVKGNQLRELQAQRKIVQKVVQINGGDRGGVVGRQLQQPDVGAGKFEGGQGGQVDATEIQRGRIMVGVFEGHAQGGRMWVLLGKRFELGLGRVGMEGGAIVVVHGEEVCWI